MDVTTALSGLSTALQYVCPVDTNARDKAAHRAPPAILIVPEKTTFAGPSTGGDRAPTTVVRALANAQEALLVVIWGRDHAQLRLLRASFITACKQVLKSFTLEAGDYADPTDVHAGEQQTLRVSFLDIVETIDLPTTAPADDTNPTLTPDAGEEVVLTDVTDIPQLDT